MGKGIGDGVPAGTGFPFLGVHTPSLHAGLTASKPSYKQVYTSSALQSSGASQCCFVL